MGLENVTACPVCGNTDFEHHLTCNDHNYSQESFQIVKCKNCTLLITTPRPSQDSIATYYQAPDYISHTGKSTGLISFIYKLARKVALNSKRNTIARCHSRGTLLDIGCGTGEFLHHMATHGWQVQGIEPSGDARNKALQLNPARIHTTLDQIDDARFTAITLWHVLEHLTDIDHQIGWIKKHLEPKGTIFVAVPNHRAHDAKKYKAHWAGYDVPRHFWHFNQNNMVELMGKHQLKIKKVLPMKLDAYYVSMLSEKYLGKDFINSYVSGFLSGWTSNQKAKRTGEYSSLLYIIGQ